MPSHLISLFLSLSLKHPNNPSLRIHLNFLRANLFDSYLQRSLLENFVLLTITCVPCVMILAFVQFFYMNIIKNEAVRSFASCIITCTHFIAGMNSFCFAKLLKNQEGFSPNAMKSETLDIGIREVHMLMIQII